MKDSLSLLSRFKIITSSLRSSCRLQRVPQAQAGSAWRLTANCQWKLYWKTERDDGPAAEIWRARSV
jgi:hypothetical protein